MTVAQIDLDVLHDLIVREPLAAAGTYFGDRGSERMKDILRFLKRCARFSTVDEKSSLRVFALMEDDQLVSTARTSRATKFNFGTMSGGTISSLTIEVREDGSAFVWDKLPSELEQIVAAGIEYRLQQGVEVLAVKGVSLPVTKVIPEAVSQFILNYFTDLKEALRAYRDNMARTSKCHLLREAWAENNRLWFKTEPEYRLRRALHNYLYAYLRHDDMDLREEQNVDDSHPVDIKIVWRMQNRSAIIEVKWIGKSIDMTTRKVSVTHSEARARKGAKQLAEYLEGHRQQAAKEDTRGYLVVFDCRRYRLKPTDDEITKKEGLHYKGKEIKFSPRYDRDRTDFEEPIRMFLEPVCV